MTGVGYLRLWADRVTCPRCRRTFRRAPVSEAQTFWQDVCPDCQCDAENLTYHAGLRLRLRSYVKNVRFAC